ncbi:uncharacterized protein V6R79_024048 [Siganus canaliculatus]
MQELAADRSLAAAAAAQRAVRQSDRVQDIPQILDQTRAKSSCFCVFEILGTEPVQSRTSPVLVHRRSSGLTENRDQSVRTLRGVQALPASPLSVTGPTVEEGPLAQLAHAAHRREKRCSCENQKDKECIFFCHIGIVWVNTPSRLVPYGFGPVRLRRDVDRCLCRDAEDNQCLSFCSGQRPPRKHEPQGTAHQHPKDHRGAFWERRRRLAPELQT